MGASCDTKSGVRRVSDTQFRGMGRLGGRDGCRALTSMTGEERRSSYESDMWRKS